MLPFQESTIRQLSIPRNVGTSFWWPDVLSDIRNPDINQLNYYRISVTIRHIFMCFHLCGATPDDTQLEAATIYRLCAPVTTFISGCSGTQIYDPEVGGESSGQHWDNGQALWSSVLPQIWTRASKAKDRIIIIIHSWWRTVCQWKHIRIWINWNRSLLSIIIHVN